MNKDQRGRGKPSHEGGDASTTKTSSGPSRGGRGGGRGGARPRMPSKGPQSSVKQDFFPRSASATASKTSGFLFNQAPINRKEVREEAKERAASGKGGAKRSAFVARLYNDEDDEGVKKLKDIGDEMKVFDMNESEDEEGKEEISTSKKRESKVAEKQGKPVKKVFKTDLPSQKINRLKFSPGSLGLFAISEVHPTYLIVNFTRNTKGFVSLQDKDTEFYKQLEVGQLIVACVTSHGTSQFNVETSGLQNKKLQLSLEYDQINKSLASENVIPGMVLQGELVSKEAKGFLIKFGLKDKSQGFLPFEEVTEHLQIGQVLTVVVKSVMPSSKVIKCELPGSSKEGYQKAINSKDLTIHNVKPGYLVAAKVQRILDNGVELNFLGGFSGTVFSDHLDKQDPNNYKLGDKLNARVVSVDASTQQITLSLLPHLVKLENISKTLLQEGVSIGKLYEQVPVASLAFGESYNIALAPTVNGFLHKIHAVKKQKEKKKSKEEQEDEEETPQPLFIQVELEKGQKIEKVIVKEINYFDGVPILSMKEDIVGTVALNYDSLVCGQVLAGIIDEVNIQGRYVVIKVNDFVKGRLYIEHMADLPLKTIPPKLTQIGKYAKVRVFYVDLKSRYVEFTKKETLLKEKTPVYQSYKDAQKGSKIIGVVVAENEYGYIIKSFGGIKGLLTFADLKAHGKSSSKDLKVGSVVKSYVLFRKKDKGMALTKDKAKAKELRKEVQEKRGAKAEGEADTPDITNLTQQYPSADEINSLKLKYKSLFQISQDQANIGKVLQFRVVESTENHFICKSLDAEKKSKNIVAILPRALVGKYQLHSLTLEDHVFEGLVIEIQEDAFPIISAQQDLIALKDTVPKTNEQLMSSEQSFVGYVASVDRRGVTIGFIDGLKKLVLVKDLETVQDFMQIYKVGKVIRTTKNKLDRLTLKQAVIYHHDRDAEAEATDKQIQIVSQFNQVKAQHTQHSVQAGEKVQAVITLVKEYGNIVAVEKFQSLTGFVLTEHLNAKKEYKEGQHIHCLVMDIDFEKEILDLSEKLFDKQSSDKATGTVKVGHQYKATVELNKEDYLLISFKQSKSSIGFLMMQTLNGDQVPNPNEKYQIGDEVEVKVLSITENGYILTVPVVQAKSATPKVRGASSTQKQDSSSLVQGQLVTGVIKSLKGNCAFLQLTNMNQLSIGRLHRLESQSGPEFDGFGIGETIKAKILKVTKENEKTWIELTRRREHMNKPADQLDETTLKKTIFSLDELKVGQQYDAVINDVNYSFSQPLQIIVSPFIKSSISFNKIVDADTLVREGGSFLQKFKLGTAVKVYFTSTGDFTMLKPQEGDNKQKVNKGDLAVVRLVKGTSGKGVTVQITPSQFGFIELSEITDDLVGNVIESLALIQPIFAARIIGFDKNQKAILSSRDSVVQNKSWELISPSGKSAHFQKYDEKMQLQGNQRNKILKYGAEVALHAGDLCIGYITNIGKSGCFVQIGHNCTVRAGLNELSDLTGFNFTEQMPVGRMVLARIYKVDDVQGKKRFNITLRKSLVVFGVNVVSRDSLTEGAQVPCTIAAVIEGGSKAFAQIKGSYLKVKVKQLKPGQVTEGDNIIVKLLKVTKQKITGTLEGKTPKAPLEDQEKKIERLWTSIEEEAHKDIEATKLRLSKGELNQDKLKALGQDNGEDEVERQFKDLKELGNDDDDMETVQNDDSDAEEMQRIIKESKVYEDEEDSEEEDEEMKEESGEEEEEESEEERFDESSEEESKATKKMSGKQSLKTRVKEEQQIRLKEKSMRGGSDQPTSIDDYERLVVSNTDQSYVWIQYMAFMLDNLGPDAARRVAERAVKGVSISNEDDKFNLWVAFMNLENSFGTQQTLESVVKRALDVNDRKKIYLQLISMYQNSQKYQYIEDIYKQLSKKFNTSLKVWTGFLEFLFTVRQLKKDRSAPGHVVVGDLEISEPKQVLQRALQSLPKDKHVNLISKFGMLEFKHGQPENGRTMFEGIVNNYPKRMDIWSIYMDMEVKYGGAGNSQQARHLFERCLTNENIMKKPKKMKLVFQKYMEYEMSAGNKKHVEKLRERVEQYLEKAFSTQGKQPKEDEDMSD